MRKQNAVTWLTPEQVTCLPYGTPLTFEQASHRGRRTRGRLTGVIGPDITLDTCGPVRSLTVSTRTIGRARLIGAVLEPGDPVLRRGIDADTWRGGVIRTDGPRVLVETLTGPPQWIDEAELVHADHVLHPPRPPAARRGRIGSDRSADLAAEAAAPPP